MKRKEETYSKEKHALDQKMAAGKRGLEDEERRLESLGTAEDLDLLTHEHYAAVDVLRMEIEVKGDGLRCVLTSSFFNLVLGLADLLTSA